MMNTLTSTEMARRDPRLTPRKIELWRIRGLLKPAREGKPGRNNGFRFDEHQFRKAQLMVQFLETGIDLDTAARQADQVILDEQREEVLVVEPDLVSWKLLEQCLSSSFRLTWCSTLQEAKEMIAIDHTRFKWAIIEPSYDLSTTEQLLSDLQRADIRHVLLTSNSSARGLTPEFVLKPASIGSLLARMLPAVHS